MNEALQISRTKYIQNFIELGQLWLPPLPRGTKVKNVDRKIKNLKNIKN